MTAALDASPLSASASGPRAAISTPAMAEGTAERTDVSPSELQIEYLDAPLVAAFLDHLEHRLPVRGGASA